MAGGCGGVAAMALPPAHSDCAAMHKQHATTEETIRIVTEFLFRILELNFEVQVRGSKSTWVVLANNGGPR